MMRQLIQTLIQGGLSLFSRIRIEVVTPDLPFGNQKQFGDFKRILDGTITQPFSAKTDRFVYFLQTPVGNYYLKRSTHETPRSVLRHLLRGRRAHTDAVWEGLAVQLLINNGFRVMEAAAWGEELWLGIWPRRGFLLVKEVIGKELVDLLANEQDTSVRCEIFEAMGQYTGRLHGTGLFHAPRVRDYIFEGSDAVDLNKMQLTMIDVDLKGLSPTLQPFDADRAIETLAVSCYLFLRTGQIASQVEALRFIRGFKSGLRRCGYHLKAGYLKALVNSINHQLTTIQLNPELKAKHQKAFVSVAEGISA